MTGVVKREEAVAAGGARWLAVALVATGLLNYGYALLLTHLLNVAAYSSFAAGQSLLLWATNVATVSVPWVLAQAVVRAQSDIEQHSAIRFAKVASAGSGIIAAAVVGIIATRFTGSATALTVAVSTFVIFLGTVTTGWLQGRERMRDLSVLYLVENLVKNGAGVLLVVVAGLGDAGALGAFGVGGIAMLFWWPGTPHRTDRPWTVALANRELWRRAVAIAGAQGLVSLFATTDVVLVALLPGNRALAASYQASATLTRVPLYVACAVAGAFFPALARRASDGFRIAAQALRMYAAVALPLAAALATIPAPLLALVFPSQYGAVATLLKYTAVTGLAAGGITLVTAFFQAADDYSCLRWLGLGLVGYVIGLLAGWRVGGITGLAAGGALGAAGAAAIMGYLLVGRQGRRVLARVPLLEPLAALVLLVVLRRYPLLWLAVAALMGLLATVRFVRPMARHRREPRWAAPRPSSIAEKSAVSLLIGAAWRGTAPEATDAELQHALHLGRLNRAEGRLARAYPARLESVLSEIRIAGELYTRNLRQVVGRLQHAGIPAVLIEADLQKDHIQASINLVVAEQDLNGAFNALADWSEYCAVDHFDCWTRALFHPSTGPVLYLHTGAAWVGAPVLPTDRLIARARHNRRGILAPAAADYLQIRLARALFDDGSLDLALLLAIRDLMRPEVVAAAREEANRQGWVINLDSMLMTAGSVITNLDRGLPVELPMPLHSPAAEDRPAMLVDGNGNGWRGRPSAEQALHEPTMAASSAWE